MLIVTHKLQGRLGPCGDDALEKLVELDRLVPLCKVEIKAVGDLANVCGSLVDAVLEDELLEEEERALVRDLLANLDHSAPRVLGLCSVARLADLAGDDELDDEGLLQDRRRKHLLLDRQLDLDTLRVGLGPDKAGVDQPHLVKATHLLQAQRQQLARLELAGEPLVGRLQVPLAKL